MQRNEHSTTAIAKTKETWNSVNIRRKLSWFVHILFNDPEKVLPSEGCARVCVHVCVFKGEKREGTCVQEKKLARRAIDVYAS